jgi:hypothetical protein
MRLGDLERRATPQNTTTHGSVPGRWQIEAAAQQAVEEADKV